MDETLLEQRLADPRAELRRLKRFSNDAWHIFLVALTPRGRL
jgi:hypothetical protein